MGPDNRIASWFRAIGQRLGLHVVEGAESGERVRAPASRKSDREDRRSEVDIEARRLRDNILGSTPRITAGELSERAERRLHLVRVK
jgi:hypothetical protein